MRTTPPAPLGFASRLTAVFGLCVGLTAATVRAADLPPPLPAKAVPGVESDKVLEKKVYAALAADPALARVPLIVSVMDRVAVVGGPVPDAALIPRATAVVKGVAGLEAVKVSCWAMAGADPFADRVADQMKKAVPPAVAANPSAPPLAPVGPRITVTPPPAPPAVAAKPPAADPAPRTTAAKVAVDNPGGPNVAAGFLLDPVAVVRRPTGDKRVSSAGPGYPTIAPPAVPVVPVSDVKPTADKVSAVRAADPRFAKLTVRVADGTAVVSGKPAQAKDAWAFAEALRTVPGVTRVIVRSTQ